MKFSRPLASFGGKSAAVHFSPGHVSGDRLRPPRRWGRASSEARWPGRPRSSRSVQPVVGGAEAIEEWVRSVGVHSPGAKAGAGQLVWPGGLVVRRPRVSAARLPGGRFVRVSIGVGCPSRPRLGDWRGVVAVRPVLKHGPRSAGGARVLGAVCASPSDRLRAIASRAE